MRFSPRHPHPDAHVGASYLPAASAWNIPLPRGTRVLLYTLPPGHPQTRFRAFLTPGDGFGQQMAFLASAHYHGALQAALAGDPALYCRQLKAEHYFTANLDPYLRAVVSLYAEYLQIIQQRPWLTASTSVSLSPNDEPLVRSPVSDLDLDELLKQIELPDWLPDLEAQITADELEQDLP